jgi:histidinol-phosphatase
MLVAEGAIDAAIDAVGLQPYDNAALYPIVSESGGRITDRHGKPSWKSDTQISTNGLLHDRIIRHLSSER